jgi:hypothetical protein
MKNGRISHVEKMRGQYHADQKAVLFLTRMTLQDLNDLKADMGRKWLVQFLVDSHQLTDAAAHELWLLDEVWRWWHNEWCRMDHYQVLPVLYSVAENERRAVYEQMHNGVLQQHHPCTAILQKGIKIVLKGVFQEYMEEEKNAVAV